MAENITVVSFQEAIDYIGIESDIAAADEVITRNVNRCIATAHAYLQGSIDTNYPQTDRRAKELALILIDDLYSNRGWTGEPSGNAKRLVNSMLVQLNIESMGGDTDG